MNPLAQQLSKQLRDTQRLLQMELESADLMDDLLVGWSNNMRGMARHNVALTQALESLLHFCGQAGVMLPEELLVQIDYALHMRLGCEEGEIGGEL